VHLGLIGVVATRDELASVLAHELSHVTQRHISRLIAQQSRQTPLLLGAMVLGALAASKNPGAAQALVVGGQALAMQNQLNFSRDMEREADRVGYGLMEPAGFAPQGFVGMFDKLQQANRLNDNGSWPYLRSHPLTTQRMADMQSRCPPGGRQQPVAPRPGACHGGRAGPRAVKPRGGCAAPVDGRAPGTGFASQPAARRRAAWYAAALASSQLRDLRRRALGPGEAAEVVRGDAVASGWRSCWRAEMELAAGLPEALRCSGHAPGERRPARAAAAHAGPAAHRGPTAEVTGPLQTWLVTHPRDAAAWQAAGSAWQAQGQPLRAVRAEAESHAARYDYAAAVDRFKAGQDLARRSSAADDHIEASIIDTRLRAVELTS
jgi:predicted Zn-dependent protease